MYSIYTPTIWRPCRPRLRAAAAAGGRAESTQQRVRRRSVEPEAAASRWERREHPTHLTQMCALFDSVCMRLCAYLVFGNAH